jgi:hypothetical protein
MSDSQSSAREADVLVDSTGRIIAATTIIPTVVSDGKSVWTSFSPLEGQSLVRIPVPAELKHDEIDRLVEEYQIPIGATAAIRIDKP